MYQKPTCTVLNDVEAGEIVAASGAILVGVFVVVFMAVAVPAY